MKLTKRIAATTLSALLAIGMATTAYAQTPPHMLFGTERSYGRI